MLLIPLPTFSKSFPIHLFMESVLFFCPHVQTATWHILHVFLPGQIELNTVENVILKKKEISRTGYKSTEQEWVNAGRFKVDARIGVRDLC